MFWLVLVTTIHSRQVQLGKMQQFPGLGFGGLWWCGVVDETDGENTWVLGVPKKLKYAGPVSFLGRFLDLFSLIHGFSKQSTF